MAYITIHGNKFRIRWRDQTGKTCQKSFNKKQDADLFKAEIELSHAKGKGWELDGAGRVPRIRDVLAEFVRDQYRIRRPSTVRRHAGNLDLFLRWLDGAKGGREHRFNLLSKGILQEFYNYLRNTGRHDHPRRLSTVKKIVEAVQRAWAWAYNEDRYTGVIPPPKRLEMREDPGIPTVAPTWEEMDA